MTHSSSSTRAALLWSAAIGLAGLIMLWLLIGQTSGSGRRGLKPKGLASIEFRDGLALDVVEFGNGSDVLMEGSMPTFADRVLNRISDWTGKRRSAGDLVGPKRVTGFQSMWLVPWAHPGKGAKVVAMLGGLKITLQLREEGVGSWDDGQVYRDAELFSVNRKNGRVESVNFSNQPIASSVARLEVDDGEGNWVVMDGPLVIDENESFAVAAGPALPGKHPTISLRVTLNDGNPPKVVTLNNPAYKKINSPDAVPSQSFKQLPDMVLSWEVNETQLMPNGAWAFQSKFHSDSPHKRAVNWHRGTDLWNNSLSNSFVNLNAPAGYDPGKNGFVIWPGTEFVYLKVAITERKTTNVSMPRIKESVEVPIPEDLIIFADVIWPKAGTSPEIQLLKTAPKAGVMRLAFETDEGARFLVQNALQKPGAFLAIIEDEPRRAYPLRVSRVGQMMVNGQSREEQLLAWTVKPVPGSRVRFAFVPPEPDDGSRLEYVIREEAVLVRIPKPTASH